MLDLVPRSTVKVERRQRRPGHRRRARGPPRRRDARDAPRHRAARQRGRRDPSDQPAGREVRPAERAVRRPQHEPLAQRRRDPARAGPAATPRSRRSSARSACCSTAAASAQLKTITVELNNALQGREGAARSVLSQIRRVHDPARRQQGRHRPRDRLPQPAGGPVASSRAASTSRSSSCPARCARSTASATTWSRCCRRWTTSAGSASGSSRRRRRRRSTPSAGSQPVLDGLADAGDNFTKAFSVFLTYPFVDEVVGRDPQVARNLHMGDYTNLSIEVDLTVPRRLPTGCRPACPPGLPTLPTCLPPPGRSSAGRRPVITATSPTPPSRSGDSRQRRIGPGKVLRASPEKLPSSSAGVRQAARTRTRPGLQAAQRACPLPHTPTAAAGPGGATVHQPAAGAAPLPRPSCRARLGRRQHRRRRPARTDDGAADDVYDPDAREPARARDGGDAMITRRTKRPAHGVRADHAARRQLTSAPATPGSTGCSSTTATPSSRTSRTPAASSPAPRSPTAACSVGQVEQAAADRRGRRRLPRHRQRATTRSRATRWPWSATGRPSASSTSSSSRRSTPSRTSPTAREIAPTDTRTPIPTQKLLTDLVDHRRVGATRRPAHDRRRARQGVRGHRAGPPADHRHLQLVHRDRQRELRHHHGADPRQQHRPQRPGRHGVARSAASPGTSRSSAAPSPAPTPTCARSSTTARRPPTSCARSSRTTGSTSAQLINNLVTTGEVVVKHLDGIAQMLVIYPYVVEGGFTVVSQVPGHGLYDAHFGMILTQTPPVCTRATRAPTRRAAAGRQRPADEHERRTAPSRRAEQRPRRPERATAAGAGLPRAGGGLVRPGHAASCLGRASAPGPASPGRPAPQPSERSRGSGCSSSP